MNDSNRTAPRILVGIDGSDNASTALRWAVEEAHVSGQSIEAMYAWHVPSLAYAATAYSAPSLGALAELAESSLTEAIGSCDMTGVTVETHPLQGQAVNALVHAADDDDVDMVVVGATGHSGLAGILLGSVARALTHRCPKPLVVVPSGWNARDDAVARRPVLVGIDLTAESRTALRWAADHARARSVPIEVLLVWGEPGSPAFIEALGLEVESRVPWFTKRLRDFVRDADIGDVPVTYHVEAGVPSEALVTRAALAQALVIGSRLLWWAHEMIAGSVSHACMSHSSVPVVLVPNVSGAPK